MSPKDTRQSILLAAVRLMGRDGMAGLTASALAREVGISKATVFHHFPTLDEVPIAGLDVLSDVMIPHDPADCADLEGFLRAFGQASLALVGAQDGIVQAYLGFATKAMFEPRLKARLIDAMEAAVARLGAALVALTGEEAAALELARLCLTTMDGLMMNAALTGDARPQAAMWDRMAGFLAREYGHANRD